MSPARPSPARPHSSEAAPPDAIASERSTMQARLPARASVFVSAFASLRAGLAGLAGLACLAALPACHAEANVKASTDDRDDDRSPPPAAAPAPVAAPPPAPTAPPTDACPLFCYVARGSVRAEVSAEESAQLRSSLEPVLGRMRSCTTADDWRRHGSPTLNLRIAPDGSLAELGVDPHHGSSTSCFDDVGRGSGAALSLPGRKVVRCAERCVREAPVRGNRRRSR